MNDYMLILASAALVSHLLLQQQPLSRLRLHVCGLAGALCMALGASGGQALERLIVAPWQLQDLRLFLLLPWLALLAWGVPRALGGLRPQWPTGELALPLLGNAMLLGLTLQATADDVSVLATLRWGHWPAWASGWRWCCSTTCISAASRRKYRPRCAVCRLP